MGKPARHAPRMVLDTFSCAVPPLSAIHFLAVADLHDEDDQFFVLNRVDDPVVAFADPIEVVFTCKFLYARRPRIVL